MEVATEKNFNLKGTDLILLPQKAIFIPNKQILLIADLHLGKVNHFRRSGIAVPGAANNKNLEILIELIRNFTAKRVIFLGDLFHSHYNEEWEALGQVVKHFASVSFQLVLGNHDIMSSLQYDRCRLEVFEQMELDTFLLTHEPLSQVPNDKYNIAGHIHPGVKLRGKARQSITLPCFYFGRNQAIMPAFGSFTGFVKVPVKKGDNVFVITDQRVIQVSDEN